MVLLAGCPWPGHARAGRQSRKDVTKLGPEGRWAGGAQANLVQGGTVHRAAGSSVTGTSATR